MAKRKSNKKYHIDIPFAKLQCTDIETYIHYSLPCHVATNVTFLCKYPYGFSKKRNSSRKKDNENLQYIAYRFCGLPNDEQEHLLSDFVGSTRFLWNRMTADCKDDFANHIKHKVKTPAYYKKQEGLEWLKEIDSLALSNTQLNFESALSDAKKGNKGYPVFHKKHKHTDSYTTNVVNGNIKFDGTYLILPKIPGKIKLYVTREVMENTVLKSVTVTHEPDGKWYFSMLFEYEKPFSLCEAIETFLETNDASLLKHMGMDMSVPYLFVSSDKTASSYENNGNIITFDKYYRRLENRIAREQRKLSHMEKDSNNYKKQLKKIARLYAKAKHQRNDFLHQVSTRLIRMYDIISIEDLDISAMKQTLNLGKSLSDNGWGEFTEMLEYKAYKNGKLIIRIDKWFPSSKQCSNCGHVHKDLQLNDKTFICPICGNTMDRDEHAAKNIDREGFRIFTECYKKLAL